MTTTIQLADRQLTAEIMNPTDLLCLPKAKDPRLVSDWAESDGKEYDMSSPIWLEAQETRLHLVLHSLTPGDLGALVSADTMEVNLDKRGRIQLRPIKVDMIDSSLTKARWGTQVVEMNIMVSSDDLLPLFGDGMPQTTQFKDTELLSRRVRIVPDWEILRLPPAPKVALERASKTSNGREVYKAIGKKERIVGMSVWITGNDPITTYLQLATELRSNVAGLWSIEGKVYYLRYQSMQIIDYHPFTSHPFLSIQIELLQYQYE